MENSKLHEKIVDLKLQLEKFSDYEKMKDILIERNDEIVKLNTEIYNIRYEMDLMDADIKVEQQKVREKEYQKKILEIMCSDFKEKIHILELENLFLKNKRFSNEVIYIFMLIKGLERASSSYGGIDLTQLENIDSEIKQKENLIKNEEAKIQELEDQVYINLKYTLLE